MFSPYKLFVQFSPYFIFIGIKYNKHSFFVKVNKVYSKVE